MITNIKMTDFNEQEYLEERFDRVWGTADEIFAPSPTTFSAFGGYDVKSDISALLSPSYERIDQKPMQEIGYEHLRRIVDELARVHKPAEIQRLASVVSQVLETDVNFHCLRINAQSPHGERSRIEYEKRMRIPNQFLEYAREVVSSHTE